MTKTSNAAHPRARRTTRTWLVGAALGASGWLLGVLIVRVGLGVTDALPYGSGSEVAYVVLATVAGLCALVGTVLGITRVWRAGRSPKRRGVDQP